jgi:hypothetical protein
LKLHPEITDKRAIKRFETLESEFNQIHNYFYDYSISLYKNSKTKFKYICPKHGVQETTSGNHLKGKKCKYCVFEKAGSYHKLDETEFIKRAKNTHGEKYDYSNVNYTNIHTPIEIVCKIHGSFFQSPNNHIKGSGCIECAGVKLKTTDQFIVEAKKLHGDLYDYSKTVYKGNKNKVTIICASHGDFKQLPNAHLKGHGCEECSFNLISLAKRASIEDFIMQAHKIQGLKYDYSQAQYVNAKNDIQIVCKDHGMFLQSPDSHLRGSGCPGCAEYGFNTDLPAILYYLKIKHNNKFYYKIGITNNDVKSRFRNEAMRKIVDYIEISYAKGRDALLIEQIILRKYSNYINSTNVILKDGNTEIFSIDVLGFEQLNISKKELLKNYLQQSV